MYFVPHALLTFIWTQSVASFPGAAFTARKPMGQNMRMQTHILTAISTSPAINKCEMRYLVTLKEIELGHIHTLMTSDWIYSHGKVPKDVNLIKYF
jgi:hypothetical protein